MQESLIEEKKKEPKFKSCDGVFWLDGVKITWKLEAKYISDLYHFNISSGKIPNLISETGYRSHFEYEDILEKYKTINEYFVEAVEYFVNEYNPLNKKKKKREYRLEFEDTGYKPNKQTTLIELQGGGN